jgi:hypothetical protein
MSLTNSPTHSPTHSLTHITNNTTTTTTTTTRQSIDFLHNYVMFPLILPLLDCCEVFLEVGEDEMEEN